jgi:Xaa-Pro aminopeptidase
MLETAMRGAGSEALPFEIIVASGRRSAMPHGLATDRVIGAGELVVVDLGARVDGYCSDITRTFATGPLTPRQIEIYRTVQEAQQLALAAAKPGARAADVDAVARGHIEAAGYGEDFGHSLGHGVGLEPHELPVLAPRSAEVLQAGMVVTVEPGIYRERTGGVRIEDTVLVGRRGPVSLTGFSRELIRLK